MHRRVVRVLAPIAGIALMLGGCGLRPAGAAQHRGSVPTHRRSALNTTVVRLAALTVTRAVQASLPGSQPAGMDLTDLAMATSEVGWAGATGLFAAETTYGLETVDGGRQFTQVFTAPQRIVGVAAPSPEHAYFLESDCISTGQCTARLQALQGGSTSPETLWQAQGVAAGALSFPTAQDGFISAVVSQEGKPGKAELFATHDGGKTWAISQLPCPGVPYAGALDFLDAEQGFLLCAGQPGAGRQSKSLYVTADGGQNWSLVASTGTSGASGALPTGGYVHSLFFQSPQVGYLALVRGGFYRTGDGGKTWAPVFLQVVQSGEDADALGFLPGGFGWLLAGGVPGLSVTQDGGRTWQSVYPAPVPQFVSDLGGGRAFGFRIAGTSALVESQDGGARWSVVAPLPFTPIALQALSSQDLVALSSAAIEESQNGGKRWRQVALPRGWTPTRLGSASLGAGWVVAQNADQLPAIFSCGTRACRRMQAPFFPLAGTATGNRSGFAVGLDAQDGSPALFETTDGGLHWTERLLPNGFNLGGNNYVGVGAQGDVRWLFSGFVILRSADGGRTWQETKLPPYPWIDSLSFANAQQGLLTAANPGSTPSIWRTEDGGETFQLVPFLKT